MRGGDDRVYFVQNLYLNQTNVCRVKCKFCAFAATQKQEQAYTRTADELVADAVREHEALGFTEIHMVNGENPHVDFDFYRRHDRAAPRGAAGRAPQVLHGVRDPPHDDALAASRTSRCCASCRPRASARSRAAAPRSSPTASAASSRRARSIPDIWFHVHDTAHRLGIPTHCTILYGHVETYEERVDHLLRLRDQQDKTGGFLALHPARVPSRRTPSSSAAASSSRPAPTT